MNYHGNIGKERRTVRLLFYEWNSLTHPYIYRALKEQGIHLDIARMPYKPRIPDDQDKFKETLAKMLDTRRYDVVFSINFFDVIAEVCHEKGRLYVSWSYDSPSLGGKPESHAYDTNRIFLFDSAEVEIHKLMGQNNIYHMHLAVDTDELDTVKGTPEEIERFSSDISFVGQLYSTQIKELMPLLSPYYAGYLSAFANAQLKVYGMDILGELINTKMLDLVNTPEFEKAMLPFAKELGVYDDKISAQLLKVFLQRVVTNKERVLMLSMLSRYYSVNLFSVDKQEEALRDVNFCGSVEYFKQMPVVFKHSKINLNITLRSILKGIPQRCLDVMGCRGLLLTNYQEDMFEYLENGKDLVVYTDIGDAVEKAGFYLKHEAAAEKIRESGYQKMKQCFNYKGQLEKIWKLSGVKL